MSDSSSAIVNIQKLIKQLQNDALQQTLKQHAEALSKIHQIMRENNLSPDMIAMSYSARKPRVKKESIVTKSQAIVESATKLPVLQK